MDGGLLVKYSSEEAGLSVVIEDDGRVVYAYLLGADDRICADVWLYNRHAAPQEPEWTDASRAPFANPAAFVLEWQAFRPADTAADLSVEWHRKDTGYALMIFLRGQLLAILEDGAKPGWSLLAKKDGPLARRLAGWPGNS